MSEPARMDVDERERIRHRLRLLRGALDALDIALDQDGVPLGTDIAQNIASSATRDSAWMRIVDALDAFTLDYEPSDDEIEAARSR